MLSDGHRAYGGRHDRACGSRARETAYLVSDDWLAGVIAPTEIVVELRTREHRFLGSGLWAQGSCMSRES